MCYSKYILKINFEAALTNPACLSKNSFQQDKCEEQVDALYACCDAFYQKNGDQAMNVNCPKASLLRLKMKQRSERQ